jgi:hypothetical protein
MDLFEPGSFSIKMVNPDGSLSDLDSLPNFLTNTAGETAPTCDCPPGLCSGGAQVFEGTFPEFLSALFGGEQGEDGYDDDDDFGNDDEDEEQRIMAIEATAQLGRIVEGLTEVITVHAGLVKQLVG